MAYEKTTWETGDVITAAKLNNAEDGIEAASSFIVNIVVDAMSESVSLDQKYADIQAAQAAGRYCPVFDPDGNPCGFVMQTGPSDGGYQVLVIDGVESVGNTSYATIEKYVCDTVNDYPISE